MGLLLSSQGEAYKFPSLSTQRPPLPPPFPPPRSVDKEEYRLPSWSTHRSPMRFFMLFLSSPPRMGGVGDRKKGVEEVWRRPNPNCPCLDDPDDAGTADLEEEEEECDDDDDFEEARIVRR
mmetsp:Transcript_19775/g.21204  ORF Transcript_19775/g.21204 Transcript_19775/m.21204 type:complete len:121 (+) Transcript_19775:134-496(+)